MFSRIDKLLRERKQTNSIAEAHSVREQDVELVVGADATVALVRPAVALALRCFTGDVIVHPEAGASEVVLDGARTEAASYGEEARLRVRTDARSGIRVGLATPTALPITADVSGWRSGTNVYFGSRCAPAAPAAAFAVSMAFGKVFARLLGAPPNILDERWSFSLLSFDDAVGLPELVPPELDIGRVVLLGAGAVGSSFAYVLHLSNWIATLRIIDSERYDDPNRETTFLISRDDATAQRWKAKTLAARAARPGIDAEHAHARLTDGHPELAKHCAAFVCAVDNVPTRQILDNVPARVLLNAGVGGTPADAGHVLWTRHGRDDAALAPLYERVPDGEESHEGEPPTEVAADDCSRLEYDGVALAAPFIGLGAGALLAASVAHSALGAEPATNYVKLDLLALQARYLTLRRTNRKRRS